VLSLCSSLGIEVNWALSWQGWQGHASSIATVGASLFSKLAGGELETYDWLSRGAV